MKVMTFRITGRPDTPMMMHNNQTADPRNHYAKVLAELHTDYKRRGSDKAAILDKMAIQRVAAGLYWNDALGLHIPASNLRATVIDGAKLSRGGANCKRYVQVAGPARIKYKGPSNLEDIANDPRFRYDSIMKNGGANAVQVPTTRAIIPEWECEFSLILIDNTKMTEKDLIKYVTDAGLYCGVGASRTHGFGRFTTEVVKNVPADQGKAAAK